MNDQQKRQLERDFATKLADATAREYAKDEALRREAWRLNAPMRRAARELVTYLDEAKP